MIAIKVASAPRLISLSLPNWVMFLVTALFSTLSFSLTLYSGRTLLTIDKSHFLISQ